MEDFRTRGVKLVALVADPVDKNAEVAAHLGLEFPILSDPDLAVIDRYGLRHSEGIPGADIARPATFVLDRNGVVRWRDLTENYRVRPHPTDVLRVIDGL
jgi:peroxiredoxin